MQSLYERFPPPARFRELGAVRWTQLSTEGPIFVTEARKRQGSAAQQAGMRYEAHAHGYLSELYCPERGNKLYAPAMWIHYIAELTAGWAQPDGLLLDFDRMMITIIEIKLRHTSDAWWALRRLYEPLIRHLFGTKWSYSVCEVCRWFNRGDWPEPPTMCAEPAGLIVNGFGIHIWSDKEWEWVIPPVSQKKKQAEIARHI